MKQFKLFILLNIIIFLSSCGTIKEGFGGAKKDNSDEFLVEKKSPLVTPPNYNELPIPSEENLMQETGQSEIRSLISKNENENEKIIDTSNKKNSTLESLILKKFKDN